MFKNVSPKVIQSMMFIQKKKKNSEKRNQPNQQVSLVSMRTCHNISIYCIVSYTYTQQNCYSLPYHYPKSVFRSLVSDCFVFPCGTAFCLYHTAKKTLRVYGALVHIAPLFVCLAVSKDACRRLFVIISRLWFKMQLRFFVYRKIKNILNIYSFQLLFWPWLRECTFFTYLQLIIKSEFTSFTIQSLFVPWLISIRDIE